MIINDLNIDFMEINDRINLSNFCTTTYIAWKNGLCLDFNSESKNLAETNSLEQFILILNDLTGNALENIDNTTGFIPNEILLFARSHKLIVTNKRYFLSEEKDISKQFDTYLLTKIRSATRSNISYMTLKLIDGTKIRYYYSGDWITREGIDKALKVLPSETIDNQLERFEKYNKADRDKDSKQKIFRITKAKLYRAVLYTFIFTGILFLADIIFNRVTLIKAFIQVIIFFPFFIIASMLYAIFSSRSDKSE
jgi:hypothetical protein